VTLIFARNGTPSRRAARSAGSGVCTSDGTRCPAHAPPSRPAVPARWRA
jgi:hypothetical protein